RRHTRLVSDWSSDVCSSDLTRSTTTPDRPGRRSSLREPLAQGRNDLLVLDLVAAPLDVRHASQPGAAQQVPGALVGEVVVTQVEIGRASCRERGEMSGVVVS